LRSGRIDACSRRPWRTSTSRKPTPNRCRSCSARTYELIRDDFSCVDLGDHEIRGFGTQRVYSVEDESARR